MDDFLNYKLDIADKEFDLLVEWLRSLGFELQTEFEVQMVKPEEVQICPMADPTGQIEFISFVYIND